MLKLIYGVLVSILHKLSSMDHRFESIERKVDRNTELLEKILEDHTPDETTNVKLVAGPVEEQP
jgi:hypothetical protein